MSDRSRVKITVLRKLSTREIFGDKPPMGQAIEACDRFKIGQEFIVGEDGKMPEGFCTWAWNAYTECNHTEIRWKLSMDEGERDLHLLLHRRTETSNLRTKKKRIET